MSGWIKLHRELMSKAIWQESTPEQKTILVTLLMMANHQENEWEWKGKRYKAEPGQFVTSLESIANKCGKGISIQNVRTALSRFEKYEFLTNESTNKNRLVTITNWGLYQSKDDDANKQTNKQSTSNQQATNKQLTTNKNDKNVKNDKKYIIYAEFVKMTEEEYNKLVGKHGEELTNKMIEVLDNYKGSKGKKYKSDYRAILSWVEDKVLKENNNGNSKGNAKEDTWNIEHLIN